jgi:hypothetical protein
MQVANVYDESSCVPELVCCANSFFTVQIFSLHWIKVFRPGYLCLVTPRMCALIICTVNVFVVKSGLMLSLSFLVYRRVHAYCTVHILPYQPINPWLTERTVKS